MNLWYPTPNDLDRHPELASLALLETAVEVAATALATAWPEIWLDDEHGSLWDEVPKEVHRLLDRAVRLRRAIATYRAMLERADEAKHASNSSDEIPF